MSHLRLIDQPFSWAIAGLAIGFGLGVDAVSVWLVAIGLGAFVAYLSLHGPSQNETEGRLFAAAPAFILGWIVGFAIHGLLF